jgi:hypothetical protein
MPNGIRFTTGSITGAMVKNNVALGINGDLGPTATTDLYSMPTPEAGKYIINKVNTSSLPNFFAPQNDTELINLAKQEGATGVNTGSAAACLSYFASKATYLPANFDYPAIVTSGLTRNFDAGFVGSYPTTGTTWYSLSSGVSSLVSSPTYRTGSGYGTGSLEFNGTNQSVGSIGGVGFPSNTVFTVSIWVYTNLSTNGTYSLINGTSTLNSIGLIYSNGTQSISIGTTVGNTTVANAGTDGNNGWVNYTVTRNSSNLITVYKNNSSIGTTTLSGQWIMQGMAKSATSLYYKGLIGSTQYYAATLLTTDQLTQNYNALKGRYGL